MVFTVILPKSSKMEIKSTNTHKNLRLILKEITRDRLKPRRGKLPASDFYVVLDKTKTNILQFPRKLSLTSRMLLQKDSSYECQFSTKASLSLSSLRHFLKKYKDEIYIHTRTHAHIYYFSIINVIHFTLFYLIFIFICVACVCPLVFQFFFVNDSCLYSHCSYISSMSYMSSPLSFPFLFNTTSHWGKEGGGFNE